MRHAIYNQKDSTLRAREAVFIQGKNYLASGTGLIFDWKTERGFLLGSASTLFHTNKPDTSSAMQLKPSPSSTLTTCSIAGSLLTCASTLIAEPPARLTPAQLSELDQLTTPVTETIKNNQSDTTLIVAEQDQRANHAHDAMTRFFKNIGDQTLLAQIERPTPKPVPTPTPAPTPAPRTDTSKPPGKSDQTTIKVECDGGLYFDNEAGVLAYLKNIRLTEPQFKLTCSHELKVFLEKKPEKPAADKPGTNQKKEKEKNLSSFGDLQLIIASGSVKVTRKDENGKLFIASAETASYNAKTGEMILRGGLPRLQQSANQFLQARTPGSYIRIHKNGKLVTSQGKWTMELVTKQPSP